MCMGLGLSVEKLSNPNTTLYSDALPRRPGAGVRVGDGLTGFSWADSKGLGCRLCRCRYGRRGDAQRSYH